MSPRSPDLPDLAALIGTLARYGVRFVLIGGQAGAFLGPMRPSFDVDVLIDCSDENLERLVGALKALGARLLMRVGSGAEPVAPPSLRVLKSLPMHQWATRFGDLDTHCSVAGVNSYADAAEVAWHAPLHDLTIQVAPLSMLIAMKEAVRRPKDELYLVDLYRLREQGIERGGGC